MKVHELQRGQRFTVPALPELPPATFDHMDGMYSNARTDDGQLVNIDACAEVVVVTANEVADG